MSGREPEVVAVMNWSLSLPITLTANFHGGDVVVNYPYDGVPKEMSGNDRIENSYCDDTDVYMHLGLSYSRKSPMMLGNKEFVDGITNGVMWYSLNGGMQDWNYVYKGAMATTIEISCEQWPPYDQMDAFWNENREAMFSYAENVGMGLRGIIIDSKSLAPISTQATINVEGRTFNAYSDVASGRFFRPLLPGKYNVTVNADGYITAVSPVIIPPTGHFIWNVTLVQGSNPPPALEISAVLMWVFIAFSSVLVVAIIALFVYFRRKLGSPDYEPLDGSRE
jgi:hypothetical protein